MHWIISFLFSESLTVLAVGCMIAVLGMAQYWNARRAATEPVRSVNVSNDMGAVNAVDLGGDTSESTEEV